MLPRVIALAAVAFHIGIITSALFAAPPPAAESVPPGTVTVSETFAVYFSVGGGKCYEAHVSENDLRATPAWALSRFRP
jgi:hypothetical protein